MMNGMSFLPQRVANDGTLDRRVMIQDTSSEDSNSEKNITPPVMVCYHVYCNNNETVYFLLLCLEKT